MGRVCAFFSFIRPSPVEDGLVPLCGPDSDGGGKKLAIHRHQPLEGTEGVGTHLTYPGEVGSGCKDIRALLHSSRPVDSVIWSGDVGCDPLHGVDPGGVLEPVGETSHGLKKTAPAGWEMELHSISGVHVGSEAQGDGDIHWEAKYNGGSVHRYQAHCGTLPVGGEMPGGKGRKSVVG